MKINIAEYQPEHQPHFERLNRAWLEEFFSVEPLDRWVLEHPDEAILNNGGRIFFAESDGKIIGTVALRWITPGVLELTKMAVDKNYRGHGAGKALCLHAIQQARVMNAGRLILYSQTILQTALHIYRRCGFQEIPLERGVYARADVQMEYPLLQDVPVRADVPLENPMVQAFAASLP